MGTLPVKLLHKGIEAPLLGHKRAGGRTHHGLFQRAMHAFMATVFTGLSRANALGANAQANPPLRQLAQAACSHRGKGRAVVGAQRLRQAVFPKHPLKPGLDGIGGGAAQGAALQDEAAVVVGDGQRVAALPVTQSHVALEVGAPALCRSVAVDQGPRIRGDAAALASWPHQTLSLQDFSGRAVGRPDLVRFQGTESIHHLLGSKALVRQLRLDDPLGDLRCGGVGVPVGSSRALTESLSSVDPITFNPLVASGPAHAVVNTEGFLAVATAQVVADKLYALIHGRRLFPGHRLILLGRYPINV